MQLSRHGFILIFLVLLMFLMLLSVFFVLLSVLVLAFLLLSIGVDEHVSVGLLGKRSGRLVKFLL